MNYNKLIREVPYFQAPNSIFDINLNSFEITIYLYLCRCSNNAESAFPSYNTISKKSGICKRKVIDTIKSLESKQLIRKIVRKKSNCDNESNVYEIIIPSAQHALPSEQDAPNKEPTINDKFSLKDIDGFAAEYSKIFKQYTGKYHPRVSAEQKDIILAEMVALACNGVNLEQFIS
ncbi:MAG TPA: helix-turn-helix domain-containing protein, partial [Patescibacteria group bacterium]|nr:helix-turn-helix domain-containing protein [Patescibacteria group bacterium]